MFPAEVNLHDLVQTRYGSRIQVYSTSSADRLMLCPQHCLSSPFPVFSAAAFNSLPSCKGEGRAQDYLETKDKETLLTQLLFFFIFVATVIKF